MHIIKSVSKQKKKSESSFHFVLKLFIVKLGDSIVNILKHT